MLKRATLFILIFLPFIGSCSLIKPIVKHKPYSLDSITRTLLTQNYELAYKQLQEFDASRLSPEEKTRYAFIKAFLEYKTKHYVSAQKDFSLLLSQNIDMQDYINWYLANSYIKTENYNKAMGYLKTIASTYTLSVYFKPSILLTAQCLSALKLYSDAIELYSTYLSDSAFYNDIPEILTRRAALYVTENDIQNGVRDYLQVYTLYPDSPYAGIAFSALSKIIDVSVLNIDHYKRATLLMMAGQYAKAATELKLAIDLNNQPDEYDRFAYLYRDLGIAYYYTGRYNDALDAFKTAIKYSGKEKPEILFWLGKTLMKDGDIDAAKKAFLQIVKTRDSYEIMAMYKLYYIFQQENNIQKAQYWLNRVAQTKTPFSIAAYWELGWYYYKNGDLNHAITYFDMLEHSRYSDDLERTKARYWKARCLLKNGAIYKAQNIFFDIANASPINYYSIMSHMWLGSNILTFNENEILLPQITDPDIATPFFFHYTRYKFLLSVGLRSDALNELNAISMLNLPQEEYLFLCYEYYKNEDYFNSLYLARTILGNMLQRFSEETLPVWFYSYPSGFSNIIKAYAKEYQIDPFILYALILQESRYKTDAISNAGALGVMQIMPSTASRVAKAISLEPFYPQLLFDPQINIGIGAWYFKKLIMKYKDNYVLSLAAYNAGEKAVDTWITNSEDCNTDEFIEDIPFDETRHYVKEIITNWVVYKMIYGGTADLQQHIYMEGIFLKKCPQK